MYLNRNKRRMIMSEKPVSPMWRAAVYDESSQSHHSQLWRSRRTRQDSLGPRHTSNPQGCTCATQGTGRPPDCTFCFLTKNKKKHKSWGNVLFCVDCCCAGVIYCKYVNVNLQGTEKFKHYTTVKKKQVVYEIHKYDQYADKENDYIFKFNEVSSHSFQT